MRERTLLLAGALLCFVGAAALVTAAGLPSRTVLQPDVIAPDFTLPLLDGGHISLTDLRGETIIINFWATWCVPCRVEMPALQSIYENYDEVHILAVNLGENPGDVRRWVHELGLTFDILLDDANRTADDYGMRAPPSTFVIAPDGTLQRVFYGPVTASQLRSVLDAI